MSVKKIVITGARGQLGTHLDMLSKNSANKWLATDVAELDLTDKEAVSRFFDTEKPDVIVNCAAYTNVDKAEDDAECAELINKTAVSYLAEECAKSGATLIHVSTDYVFGGDGNTPKSESDATSPLGVYGRTKLDGEKAVEASGCHHIIIRTAWLYSAFGNNFVKTMLRLTSEKERLNVVFDQTGSPTYAGDLADAIFEIVEKSLYEGHDGIYHYTNEGVCTWYDLARETATLAGNDKCVISPCRSSEFPSKVERPHYSVLDKRKFKETFGIIPPYWRDSLKKCLAELGVLR